MLPLLLGVRRYREQRTKQENQFDHLLHDGRLIALRNNRIDLRQRHAAMVGRCLTSSSDKCAVWRRATSKICRPSKKQVN
jgi:hypothetical protein